MHTRRSILTASLVGGALLAAGCSNDSNGGGTGKNAQGSQTPAQLDRTDYNPQPYEKLKDGGTFTSSGSFSGDDTQGLPWNVNASLTGSRLWAWYNPVAITFSPSGEVQVNKDYFTDIKDETKDGKQIVTITINPKAVYNDGTPIDWRAIEATWKAASGKIKGAQVGGTTGYDQIESVVKGADDRQAVITFSTPYTGWPALFKNFLHPKAATAEAFNTAYSNKLQPEWGAGPFTVENYDPNSKKLSFKRNPKWWGRTARLEKRIYLDLPNSQASVNSFKNGQIDYTSVGTAEARAQVKDVPDSEIRQGGSPFQYSLFLNGKSPILGDVVVRHALLASIDREQIAKIQFQGLDYSEPLPGSNLYYPFQKGYRDNLSQALKYSPEEASKLLEDAGWKLGSDGIREKDGKRLSVNYTLFGSEPSAKAEAASIAASAKKAGIEVVTKPTDDSQWASVINGSKFDLVLSGNRSTDPYGAFGLGGFYGSDNPQNITRVGSAEVDAKIKKVNAMADADEQQKAANDVEVEAFKQYGLLPLFSGPSTYAVKKGLANVGATLLYTPLPEEIGWEK